jgi:hypothetical protein
MNACGGAFARWVTRRVGHLLFGVLMNLSKGVDTDISTNAFDTLPLREASCEV